MKPAPGDAGYTQSVNPPPAPSTAGYRTRQAEGPMAADDYDQFKV